MSDRDFIEDDGFEDDMDDSPMPSLRADTTHDYREFLIRDILQEVKNTPPEQLANLLQLVRLFRHSVTPKLSRAEVRLKAPDEQASVPEDTVGQTIPRMPLPSIPNSSRSTSDAASDSSPALNPKLTTASTTLPDFPLDGETPTAGADDSEWDDVMDFLGQGNRADDVGEDDDDWSRYSRSPRS